MRPFASTPAKEQLISFNELAAPQQMPVKKGNSNRCRACRIALVSAFVLTALYIGYLNRRNVYQPHGESAAAPSGDDSTQYRERFVQFMDKFGREYESQAETMRRFGEYERELRRVSQHNKNKAHGSNAVFGETELSDWTDEEFKKSLLPMTFYNRLHEEATFIRRDPPKMERAAPAPASFDWRTKGVVTPVKAQGKCGSCWAFASTATVEAAWAIKDGQMRNLSEQTLLDCDLADDACDGGNEDRAFRFIHRHGLFDNDVYPYQAHRQNGCLAEGTHTTKIEIAYFLHQDEDSIIDWLVNYGPVNIGMSVIQPMRSYKGGVFTPSEYACQNEVIGLHALLIVGYGTSDQGEKYWIIKNSWGQDYGVENGYIYFARGINACGVEMEPIGIIA